MEETPEQRIAKMAASFVDSERIARRANQEGFAVGIQRATRKVADDEFHELAIAVDDWRRP